MNTPEYYAKFAAPSSFEGSYVAPQKSFDFDAVYNYAGKNLGYITRYPELSPYGDSEQIQAEKQSGWDKALNSGLQLGALATNTFANHFYSYGRQASALTNQDWSKLWQDDFGQESAQMIQGVSDLYPIYETEEQQRLRDEEGGLSTSLKQFVPFTGRAGNAWANLAGQLGFMAGTAGAVALESAGLAALTAATEGVAAPLALTKTVSNAKLLKSMYTLYKNARTGLTGVKNAAQSAGLIGNIVKSPVFTTYRMLTAAQGEAAIEANINALEYKNKQLEKYGVNVTPEQMQEIDTRATELGNTVFNWNAPVLMLGNAMTIGSLFRVGNLGKSATSQLIKEEATGVIKKKFGELTTKEALNPFIKKTWEFSKKGGKFVVNENLYEGVEEVLQGIGGRAAQHMYETYDSEGGKGLDAFLTALGEETSNTFSTREGWDEFVSGALTGYGIKGITSVYNRATGATAKEQAIRDFTQKGVEQDIQSVNNYMKSVLTNTDPNTNYVKNQVASIEQQETAIADGNVKVAKDAQGQTKIGLFSKLQKYGTSVSDDIFDLWGETMKEMQKTNETDFRQMMGDRNVEEVVSKLKQENKQFNDVYNTIDKNAKNPYNQKTDSKNYQLYEQAKLFAAGMEYNARDSKERGQAIVKDLTTNFGIDETLIASMFDGTTLRDNLTTAKKLFKLQEEALKNAATPEEREALEQELLKSKEKVELLQAIETGAFDEKGNPVYGEKNPEETAAMFIKAYYRDKSALVPDELKKNIEDLITLETESEGYLAAYNFLSNKDYLEKFAESYLNEANKKIAQSEKNISRNQKAASKPIITPEEKYDDNQVDEALTGTTAKASITDFLEEVRSKKQSDGTYLHNGKKYNTAKELAEDLKKETEGFEDLLDQTNDKGESIDSILEKALNNLEEELTEPGDAVRKTEGQPKQVIQPKTKTQSEAEIKKGFWQKSSPYNTKVHSFDLVISFLFPKDLSYLFDSLVKANQNDVLNVIQNGLSRIGRGARVTMINLADETVIDVSRINNPEQIEVISDGIRFYIITPADVAPNVVIKEQLGLEVGDAERKFTTIRNDKGTVISSPFRAANQITPASDDVIHSLKIDDEVEIFVADNQYNRDLQDKRNNNEITEQEYTDKLVLSVVKNGEIIGVLRAADFLFEQEENQAQMDEFRSQFANRELGDRIGSTPVQGFEVARGYNYVNGQIQYTTLNEYNPVNYSTSFYFVKEDGTIIDEQGNEVQEDFFDRGSFAQGGVYMRVDGVNNKKNHTVQVLRSDNDNSVFTEEEFTSGKFKEIGQTSLSDEPIISKRISISLRQVKDTDTTHSEGIKEQVQNITDNKVLSQEEEKEVAKLEKDLAKKQESLDKVNRQIDENKERVKKYNESGVLGQAEYKKLTKKDIDLNISKQSLEKDIQDINQKIKLIKGDRAVIEDVNGAQTVVDSVVESENETVLISVNGETVEVKLSEISSVEPVETSSDGVGGEDVDVKDDIERRRQEKLSQIKPDGKTSKDRRKVLMLNEDSDKTFDESLQEAGYVNVQGVWVEPDINIELLKSLPQIFWEYLFDKQVILVNDTTKERGGQSADRTFKNESRPVISLGKNSSTKGTLQLIAHELGHFEFRKLSEQEKNSLKNYGTASTWYVKGLEEGTYKSAAENYEENFVENYAADLLQKMGISKGVDRAEIKINSIYKTIFDKINAKYDAELDALQQPNEETIVSEQQLPAEQVQTAPTEQDANKWIAQNAKTGDKLILTDGTEIEIVSNEDGVITIKRTKNDTTVQQVFRVLPDGTVVSDEPLSLEKAEEPLALPRKPQDTTVIDSFRERLRKHGIESEVVLSALSQVYQKSINEGNPITNLDDLIEASGLTATQKEQLQMVLTPVYRMGVWQFLTNSDTIFDIAQQERWAAFQTTIKSILEESSTVESSLPTDNLKNEFKLNVIDALSDVFNNFKIGIKNIEIANTFTLPDWNKITSALSAAVNTINPREAIVKLQQDLAELGLQVYAKGLIQVARVSRASLGRNPQVATDYNNVYTDLSMANVDGKIFVRNEKDGLFVEVKATKKKFSENVINIQKDLLSLLGVKFPLEYLNAYQRINGDFAALKERAIYEQQRADALPNFSFSEIKPESISFVTEDLFVSKYSASTLSLDGKKYYNLLTLENGETVYAPINKRLNSAEVRNLLKRNGLNVGKIVRKDQSFAERLSKIAKIKKQLEKITCN
jgi:hypothetical protein